MADNKLLLKRDSDQDFLAEDDPLAELARLVGFDPAPAAKAAAPAQRREPAFDLEDELLRELEVYAEPPVADAGAIATARPMAAEPAPASVESARPEPEIQPEPAREPVILEAVETFTDGATDRVYERPASHPVFDLEDEILREFSAFDARRVSRAEEHSVAAEVVHQEPPASEAVPVELHDVPDVRAMSAPRGHGRDIYESFRDDDLDDAISNAFAPQPAEVVSESAADEDDNDDFAPRIEEIADSEPVAEVYRAEEEDVAPATEAVAGHDDDRFAPTEIADDDEPAQVAFVAPSIEEFVEPVAEELVSQDFADTIPAVAAVAAPVISEALERDIPDVDRASTRQVSGNDYDLDALLAEVEKYPVGDNTARWGVQSKPVAADEIAKAAPPIVHDFVPQAVPAPVVSEPARIVAGPVADSVSDDGNFDIDLGQIELDLSDLDESDISVSPDLLAELADVPVVQPATRTPETAETDYSSLPFDPSQVAQEEETVEAIAEMDVPDVPAVHEEEKPAPHPEYDIDLDAEMAQLFATATAQPAAGARSGQVIEGPASAAGTPPRSQAGGLDLDEFERALEEDFRRSFAENRPRSNPERVALAPVHAEIAPARSRRSLLLLASAAVAVVLFGGAGVYAYMSGETRILTSSEPKVILADTEPVKVVPEDPGGKQVPNQNKAVYDRVAGAKTDETKQENLVTSNEEPVDVVQRTLMPETLPMDDDTMAAATPTGDTIDPRLLPSEEEQDRVTTTNKVVSGVSPRKVKTMVVRPDGSLMEREVTEADLKQQAANDAELMKIAQKAARDAATASDSQTDDIAKAIESVPERLAPNDDTAAKPADEAKDAVPVTEAKPETATEAKVADVKPVEPVKIEPETPDVAEKPVDDAAATTTDTAATEAKPEPVAVEEKPVEVATETKPVETAVAEKPVERSISVDEQAVVDTDAAAKVANADVDAEDVADAPVRKVKTTKITPVPEVRPVDQPVNVVGTVTDQGTVRSETEAKPQEVALADSAKQPAETTALPAGSYVIQIASLPSEAEAQNSYTRLSSKFAGVIGGKGVDIRRADIKNKGTYYRVRIPAGSKQEAQALCAQYKKAGGSCLVSK